jgi:hypothetical protein
MKNYGLESRARHFLYVFYFEHQGHLRLNAAGRRYLIKEIDLPSQKGVDVLSAVSDENRLRVLTLARKSELV